MKKILLTRARELRKNCTDAEYYLWYFLRNRNLCGYKFKRQQPFGSYIVDFVCEEKKLIIELDGEQHAENELYDERRTTYLNQVGYKVLRFWNSEILREIDNSLEVILYALGE